MSSDRNASIYILLSLLLLTGILVFVFRANLLTYFSDYIFGTEDLVYEQKASPSAASELDLEILKRDDFKTLSNQVQYFNFNVVGRPDLGSSLSGPNWPAVYKGNFNPFFQRNTEPGN